MFAPSRPGRRALRVGVGCTCHGRRTIEGVALRTLPHATHKKEIPGAKYTPKSMFVFVHCFMKKIQNTHMCFSSHSMIILVITRNSNSILQTINSFYTFFFLFLLLLLLLKPTSLFLCIIKIKIIII